MKFIISKSALVEAISYIQNVVSQRATIPILSNFLLEATQNELILTATDLTVSVRCKIEAKIISEGSTTLPARRFFQLIKELTATHIEFSCNTDDVSTITAGDSVFKLNGMSKNEFPKLPNLDGSTQFVLTAEDLKEAFFKTSFAVSKEEHRHTLNGVLMEIKNGEASFIATDGKRLSKFNQTIDIDKEFSARIIIPIKAVDEIIKIPGNNKVKLYLIEDRLALKSNNITIITKLISGEYPDVSRIIPQKSDLKISLNREELMSLLRQISLFTSEQQHSVRFNISNANLQLSANNTTIGNAKVNMPINYDGQDLKIAFNPSHMLDILRHSKEENINLELVDCYNPGVIFDNSSALYIIMPMRLSEE